MQVQSLHVARTLLELEEGLTARYDAYMTLSLLDTTNAIRRRDEIDVMSLLTAVWTVDVGSNWTYDMVRDEEPIDKSTHIN